VNDPTGFVPKFTVPGLTFRTLLAAVELAARTAIDARATSATTKNLIGPALPSNDDWMRV
jgi:hypothetical protein